MYARRSRTLLPALVAALVAGLLAVVSTTGTASAAGQAVSGPRADRVATSTTAPPAPRRVNCRVRKCVALTYDDGPAATTPRLLATLRRTRTGHALRPGQRWALPGHRPRDRAQRAFDSVTRWDHAQLTKLSSSSVSSS